MAPSKLRDCALKNYKWLKLTLKILFYLHCFFYGRHFLSNTIPASDSSCKYCVTLLQMKIIKVVVNWLSSRTVCQQFIYTFSQLKSHAVWCSYLKSAQYIYMSSCSPYRRRNTSLVPATWRRDRRETTFGGQMWHRSAWPTATRRCATSSVS